MLFTHRLSTVMGRIRERELPAWTGRGLFLLTFGRHLGFWGDLKLYRALGCPGEGECSFSRSSLIDLLPGQSKNLDVSELQT